MRSLLALAVLILSIVSCTCEDGYKSTEIKGGGFEAKIPTAYSPCRNECHTPGESHGKGKYSCWCSNKCACH